MEGGRDRDQAMVRVREAQQRVRSARAGALVAKRRELAAHERAIKRHEEAAAVQERFGIPIGRPMPASMLGTRGS